MDGFMLSGLLLVFVGLGLAKVVAIGNLKPPSLSFVKNWPYMILYAHDRLRVNYQKSIKGVAVNPMDYNVLNIYRDGDLVFYEDIVYICAIHGHLHDHSIGDNPITSHKWQVWKKRIVKIHNNKGCFSYEIHS